MLRLFISGFALTQALSPIASADAKAWPELFKEAVTPRSETPAYSFESQILDNGFKDGEILHYKVNQTGDKRDIELISIPSDAKEDKLIEQLSEGDGDIWCDDYRSYVLGDVALLQEDQASATFAFMLNPDTTDEKTEKKIFKKTQMTVTIDKADKWVTGFSYKLLEPVKPMVVAKVREFSLVGECTRSNGGRPHVSSMETRVSGSAMGSDFDQQTNQTISNVILLGR